jgi:hypothetical protein
MIAFKKARQAMLEEIVSKIQTAPKTVRISFNNDDIPKFLKELDEFEANSRKKSLLIK